MSTAVLELPQDLHLQEGQSFSMEIEGVAHSGRWVVNKVRMRPSQLEKTQAIERFLRLCEDMNKTRGDKPAPTDEELDEMRWQYLKEKHLR